MRALAFTFEGRNVRRSKDLELVLDAARTSMTANRWKFCRVSELLRTLRIRSDIFWRRCRICECTTGRRGKTVLICSKEYVHDLRNSDWTLASVYDKMF